MERRGTGPGSDSEVKIPPIRNDPYRLRADSTLLWLLYEFSATFLRIASKRFDLSGTAVSIDCLSLTLIFFDAGIVIASYIFCCRHIYSCVNSTPLSPSSSRPIT